MEFYFGLPLWLSSLLVLAASVAVCLGGHRLVRALIPKTAPKPDTELAAALMGVVSSFIGIMLAFAAFQVWEDYGTADAAVAHEAAAMSELYRDLTVYGDETAPARAAVKTYVRAILEDEWPRLARGEAAPEAAGALIGLFREVGKLEPQTPRQTVMFGEIFAKLNVVVEHRRERMIAARAALPTMFWMVVLAGSAIIVAFTFVYPASRTNSAVIAGLAVSLGLIFVFILNVDHPFAGAYAVDSRELSDLLPLFERIDAPG